MNAATNESEALLELPDSEGRASGIEREVEDTDKSIDGGVTYNISKSTDGGTTWTILNPSEVHLNQYSGFTVSGEVPGPTDTFQPFVTIRLFGNVVSPKGDLTPFDLQTSVSQRLIDIGP